MLPVPNLAVVFQRVRDGAVLLDTQGETYYGLNEVGARIWELLPPASSSIDELCLTLIREFPDAAREQVENDVISLLESLTENGLVISDSSSTAALIRPIPSLHEAGER